jgi:hypothetical protein
MTRIVTTSGDIEFVSPREARERVTCGDAKYDQSTTEGYTTRQLKAEVPKEEKPKRTRRTKAEMELAKTVDDEPESV